MKNRTVIVRMLSSDQIASVTEHAKNLGALAFEVHETESGEYRSIKDAGEYYHNGFTNHPYVEDAIEAGYTQNRLEKSFLRRQMRVHRDGRTVLRRR